MTQKQTAHPLPDGGKEPVRLALSQAVSVGSPFSFVFPKERHDPQRLPLSAGEPRTFHLKGESAKREFQTLLSQHLHLPKHVHP